MSGYRTTSGPERGPILWAMLEYSIGVVEGDRLMPCGIATPVTWDDQGRTLFTLIVRGTALPGRYVVVDRRFIPADVDG